MLVAGMLQWWYGKGWKIFISGFFNKLRGAADFFSLNLLVRTLFSPFRQISAGQVGGSLDARFHAALDRLVSRIIGAILRLGILIIGTVLIIIEFILGLAMIILWPVVPAMPAICIVLCIMGVA